MKNILILGAVGKNKGSEVLQECAAIARRMKLPLHFVLVGYSDRDADLKKIGNFTITGKYEEEDLPSLIAKSESDLAFFPAVCPETFSYTLSAVMAQGIFPVAFDIGAIAQRLKNAGWGKVVPREMMDRPEQICEILLRTEPEPISAKAREIASGPTYANPLKDYYGVLLDG